MNERTFHASNAHVLDDPARLQWLPPGSVSSRIGLRKGMIVADVGAGTGYFALPFADVVGEEGKVYAVDFQAEMLEKIRAKLAGDKRKKTITLVSGEASATNLAEGSVDLVFMANLWHELDDTAAVLAEVERVLRPGGTLSIVDWRSDLPSPPGPPPAHRVGLQKLQDTLVSQGWSILEKGTVGLYSHVVIAAPPSPH